MQASQLHKKTWDFLRAGKFAEALPLAQKLAGEFPEKAESWFTFSYLAFQLKDMVKAETAVNKAISLDDSNLEYKAHLAQCKLHLGFNGEALKIARPLIEQQQLSTTTLNILATLFNACGEQELFLTTCQRAVQQSPNDALLRANLAEAYNFIGNFVAAEQEYQKAIELNPQEYTSYLNLSLLKKWDKETNHIEQLNSKLHVKEIPWRGEMQLHFALGKEHEDLKQSELAFEHYAKGCELRRSNSNYSVNGDIETIDTIIDTFDGEFCSQNDGCVNAEAIFIVGLPRTGTTLVERILSAHSDVYAAGELNNFSTLMVQQVRKKFGNQKIDKNTMVQYSTELNFENLGQGYIASTRPRTGHSKKFIDKLPLNYLYLPLIARALPNAKIICLERNPMDACFAMFKTLFGQAYPFSYSLDDLASYYSAYWRMMQHYKQVLSEQIHFVSYEDIVAQQEQKSRELIEFCGLDWQSACLDFHQQQAAVSTASSSQVRQPIYNSSIERWKLYSEQLNPLRQNLIRAGVKLV